MWSVEQVFTCFLLCFVQKEKYRLREVSLVIASGGRQARPSGALQRCPHKMSSHTNLAQVDLSLFNSRRSRLKKRKKKRSNIHIVLTICV